MEGTRFTAAKHKQQKSSFQHLLNPRADGVGFVLGAMGQQLHTMINVTIVYHDKTPSFWDFLCGRGDNTNPTF